MTELLDQVRWDIEWRSRIGSNFVLDAESVDAVINRMTPLELLTAISNALETIRKEEQP